MLNFRIPLAFLATVSTDVTCMLIVDQYSVLMATCSSTKNEEERILKCVEMLIEKNVNTNAYDRLANKCNAFCRKVHVKYQ